LTIRHSPAAQNLRQQSRITALRDGGSRDCRNTTYASGYHVTEAANANDKLILELMFPID
jgi:hypothetical protein